VFGELIEFYLDDTTVCSWYFLRSYLSYFICYIYFISCLLLCISFCINFYSLEIDRERSIFDCHRPHLWEKLSAFQWHNIDGPQPNEEGGNPGLEVCWYFFCLFYVVFALLLSDIFYTVSHVGVTLCC
jgi:hypothetical protein